MAKVLTIEAGERNSQTFVPQTSFLVYAGGVPNPPATYQVQMRPKGVSSTWVAAQSNRTVPDLSDAATGNSLLVNGSPGFEYRVYASANVPVGMTATLYWDHVTSLRSIYN